MFRFRFGLIRCFLSADPILGAAAAILEAPETVAETVVEPVAIVAPATKPRKKATAKKKATKKAAAKVVKVTKKAKRGRGRPKVYSPAQERYFAKLMRKNTATHVRKVLNAKSNSKLAQERDLTIVPKPLNISMPTLLKIASEHNVELAVGRPKIAKAA